MGLEGGGGLREGDRVGLEGGGGLTREMRVEGVVEVFFSGWGGGGL